MFIEIRLSAGAFLVYLFFKTLVFQNVELYPTSSRLAMEDSSNLRSFTNLAYKFKIGVKIDTSEYLKC